MEKIKDTKKAMLDLTGATCTSCAITIEHVGKKFDGVRDIFVDRSTKSIQVEYETGSEPLENIIELVRRIGYDASVRVKD